MTKNNDYKILELDHPHGFLIWRGKQTAIGTPESLPVGEKLLIVSEDEAFGYVTLKAPAQMKSSEFDREEYHKEHRLYPTEWRLDWPEVEALNLYRFELWEPFEKALPFENGEIVTDEPTPHEAALIDKSRYLPKTLVLEDEAITMTGGKFTIADGMTVPDDLKQILQTTYETEVEFVDQKHGKYLPLYRLALVRVPNMRIKKKGNQPDSGAEAMSDEKMQAQQDTPAVTASATNEAVKKMAEIQDAAIRRLLNRHGVKTESQKQEDEDMPWEKVRDHADCPSDEPIAVVKTDTGEVEGCHANEEAANRQLAALNASEKGEDAVHPDRRRRRRNQRKETNMDKEEKHYDEVAGFALGGVTSFSELMEAEQAEISAENVHRLTAQFQMMIGNIMASPFIEDKQAAINNLVEEFGALVGETMQETKQWQPLTDLTKKAINRIFKKHDDKADKSEPESDNPIDGLSFDQPFGIAVKTVDGEPWHFSWSTNAFRDRDGEIFTTKALENFVVESEQNGYKGFFNLWHIEGTDFAVKEWKAVVGRFLVEAGPYLDNEAGRRAKAFFQQYSDGHPDIAPEGWGASPEFRFLPEERAKDGIFHWLWITRTSTLPRAAAANIWTKGMSIMAMTQDQEQAAIAAFGKDFVENLKRMAEKETAVLEKVADHKAADDSPEESEQEPTAEAKVTQTEDEPEEVETDEEESEDSESDDGEAVPVVNVPVDELAAEVKKQFEFDLQPVADAMAEILEQVKAVGDRVTKLEKQESVKQQVETPRFMLNLVRASQAEETALTDEDELKTKQPKEAPTNKDGTLMGSYFGNK